MSEIKLNFNHPRKEINWFRELIRKNLLDPSFPDNFTLWDHYSDEDKIFLRLVHVIAKKDPSILDRLYPHIDDPVRN